MSNNLKSEAPTCEDYGEAVNDFLTSVGVEKVYLVANSFGTVVGQCFASRYPQKVTKIALTGTLIGAASSSEAEKKAALEGRRKGIEGGSYAFGSGRVQALVGKNTSEEKLALLRSVLRAADLRGYMQACALVVGTDTRPLAPKLTMPVLMIQGTEDRVAVAKDNSYVLKPLLANAKLQEVPGAGHLPEFEVPDVFNKAVLDFFAQ
jgi:pimeloyl-ACP methyl ester carboxylesterase